MTILTLRFPSRRNARERIEEMTFDDARHAVVLGLLSRGVWCYGAWGIALIGGCQGPTEIVPISAPGASYSADSAASRKRCRRPWVSRACRRPSIPSRKKAVAGTVSPPTAIGETKTTPSGVKYETLKEGDGPELKPGQTVVGPLHRHAHRRQGLRHLARKEKDEPRTFEIGAEKVIAGWDEGVPGMKVGERRKLTIPPELGYGEQGNPPRSRPTRRLSSRSSSSRSSSDSGLSIMESVGTDVDERLGIALEQGHRRRSCATKILWSSGRELAGDLGVEVGHRPGEDGPPRASWRSSTPSKAWRRARTRGRSGGSVPCCRRRAG